MNNELDFIKLKVDWYKSAFPWILAMVIGAITFARATDSTTPFGELTLIFLVGATIFLLVALLSTWYAALALIHRLEAPYTTSSRFLNAILWVPHGNKWEMIFGSMASFSLGGGFTAIVIAVMVNAAK